MQGYIMTGIITLIIFLFSVLGFLWKLTKDIRVIPGQEAKYRKRIYERFDEHKENIKKEYVAKEVCGITNNFNKTTFDRLEDAVQKGFKNLDCKIADLNSHLITWMQTNGKQK